MPVLLHFGGLGLKAISLPVLGAYLHCNALINAGAVRRIIIKRADSQRGAPLVMSRFVNINGTIYLDLTFLPGTETLVAFQFLCEADRSFYG
jgi:hypothetical protein